MLNQRYLATNQLQENNQLSSAVFEAMDTKELTKPKVIKILYTDDDKAQELFHREVNALININIPGIPKVEADGDFLPIFR